MKSIKILEEYVQKAAEAEEAENKAKFRIGKIEFEVIASDIQQVYCPEKKEIVFTFSPSLMIGKELLTPDETKEFVKVINELFGEENENAD